MPDPNPTASKSAQDSAETPEDVATLYSWANLHGAKYRDFSASRAQAREEARLRAEEAAAAERRRQEEEAERHRQEEAQIAAREAAEAAEAARQAEAERLAEIARQAEVERQAVLAAQEAQRQAAQQRAWQSPPAEVYTGDYNAAPEPAVDPAHRPAFDPPTAPPVSFLHEESPRTGLLNEQRQHEGLPAAEPVSRYAGGADWPRQYVSASGTLPGAAAPFGIPPAPAMRSTPAFPMDAAPAESAGYPESRHYYPAARPVEESYMPSPWLSPVPEEQESREQPVRPAWLAPEIPPATANRPSAQTAAAPRPVPMYAQSLSQGAYPAYHATPQSAGQQYPGTQNSGTQNPNQTPNQTLNPNPQAAPAPSPHYGLAQDEARDRTAGRWFALKSVFDPQSAPAEPVSAIPPARVPVLAVFSLAGGVGKTSLVASLGRSLSSRGERVLLVDTAPYGLLPFFFGARDQRPGQLRTFNPPGVSLEAPIQLVTLDPETQPQDVPAADPGVNSGQLQASGVDRAPGSNPEWLVQEILRLSRAANRILIDLPTASGAATRRILRLNPTVLVPVVPDMSSVVSVGAIESFFRHNGQVGGKQIMPYYVLNQFDYSLPLHLDVREVLREQIGDRLLPFALRRSPAVSEALAEGMTVIDYAPSAVLAEDYASLAGWVRSLSAPATQTYRGVRWSER